MDRTHDLDCTLKKDNPGKATGMAIGKAFPPQLVMKEFLVDGCFKKTNCNNPDPKRKLERLYITWSSSVSVFIQLLLTVVMSEEILANYPELSAEGLPTLKQRLGISNKAVTEMAIEAWQTSMCQELGKACNRHNSFSLCVFMWSQTARRGFFLSCYRVGAETRS